jgi:transglutaminase-like putative cysteine protease
MLHRCLRAAAPLVFALAVAAAASAEVFPPITAEERALTAAPGQPNAPAVVLFRNGELRMMDPSRQEVSSQLVVRVRLKILTAAGKERGNVQIEHSGSVRLQGFEGRTVLPDGTVVPVPRDATFKRTVSRARRFYVTSIAFPSVQVGAILDYQYSVRWDSIFFLEPWFFQDRVPVLHSEIAYEVPKNLQVSVWQSDPLHAGIKSETGKSVLGRRVRAWADHLAPVPEEIHSLPFADMAAQLMMVPTAYVTSDVLERLFESWPATCRVFEDEYDQARRKDGDAARRAREIAGRVAAAAPPATPAAAPSPSLQRRQAAAIYDFVRDEIATEEANHVWLPQYSTAAAVLDKRRGEPAEKAVLLQAMLGAVRIESRLVWAADRENGAIDMRVANPAWFDRVLVAAQIDGQRVFLDPADRALAFGHLEPGYEGTMALVFDRRKPESIVLPEASFGENLRRARLELTLDSGGRATGAGTLTLLGQSAWRRTRWTGDAATSADAWEPWLREQFPGFDVGGVAVAETLDQARVDVAWTLSQHPDDALGDQATLVASRPLGPVRQLFPPGAKRLSAVVFDFGERSEVELVVHWAAGWQPEVLPRAWKHSSPAGAVETSVDVDGAGRTLVYRRRFDNVHRQAATAEQFNLVQALFEEAQKNDAQPLVLSRR